MEVRSGMKITNFALVFICFAMIFVVKHYVFVEAAELVAFQEIQLNQIVDTALMDSADALVVRGNQNELVLDREGATNVFFETLYQNFNARTEIEQVKIDLYVPVMVLVDHDGFSVYSMETYNGHGGKTTGHVWSEKIPYVWTSGQWTYQLTLGDQLRMVNAQEAIVIEGSFEELSGEIDFAFNDYDAFNNKRKTVISELISMYVQDEINNHQSIASHYGVTYDFRLPAVDSVSWGRAIEDIGLLAFVQGIPIGVDGTYYNQCALGGAMVKKGTPYYIEETVSGWLYYHKEGCSLLPDKSWPIVNRQEGAEHGAFPCEHCKP